MTINFTLFIQMFHFFIAYLIISKLLLKPALLIIQSDKKNETDLLNDIKLKNLEITEKELLQKSLLIQSAEYFEKNKPILKFKKMNLVWQIPKIQEITENNIAFLKESVTDFITNKVKNVQR